MSNPSGLFFPLPNEVFLWGLTPNELAVYSYLRCRENRQTHQCWPSYNTIAEAVNLSPKTVRKYVCSLADKGLIFTENTSVFTRDGRKRNGTLRYTVIDPHTVAEAHHQAQLDQVEQDTARWKAQLHEGILGPPAKPSEAVSLGKGRTA